MAMNPVVNRKQLFYEQQTHQKSTVGREHSDSADRSTLGIHQKKKFLSSNKGSASTASRPPEVVPLYMLNRYPEKPSQKMRIKKKMRGDYGENSSVEKLSRGNNMLIKVKEYQSARSGARTEKKLRKTSPN